MLKISSCVFNLGVSSYSRTFSVFSSILFSSCGPEKIKEAPILNNECVMALPEETKALKNLENNICVPEMVDLTPVNGIPTEYLMNRRARIYQPSRNVMQSGTNNIRHWEIEFDNRLRWENPLMGWTSSADALSCLKIRFQDPCTAIEYCEKNGWIWYVDVPRPETEFRHKNYSWNFSYNKRTRVSTK